MKKMDLPNPQTFKVSAFLKNFFQEGKNELCWLSNAKQSIEVSHLEKRLDRIMAKAENGSTYTIFPSKSKHRERGFSLMSNEATLTGTWDLILDDKLKLSWLSYKGEFTKGEVPLEADVESVLTSLGNKELLRAEVVGSDGAIEKDGFRAPQIGAIHAIMSNWAVERIPITVVLPTGTGKSESILGTIISNKIRRSLIVVPSDSLRNQFYKNCKNWGILRKIGIIEAQMLNPIVFKIVSSPKKEEEFMQMLCCSNIAIATTAILNNLQAKFISKINELFDAVFIDEAHHTAAPTWEEIRSRFGGLRIVQFTATPFREDKKPIKGKVVFNYSLESAQKNKFFTKIDFIPVIEYDSQKWDKTIAEKAVELLRSDIAAGHNHFLMARVDHIGKAKQVYEKYYKDYTEFNPILITSKSPKQNELIDKLRTGESKIVVCVNMLGEGVDIPELKIAALHDIRKSLTVTLQFIGRFTRSNRSESAAKVIANIADVSIERKLKQLYKEDADWGRLIAFASAKEIQKKIKFQEVLANFRNSTIPLYNIKPKMSAVVYRVKSDAWFPKNLDAVLSKKYDLYLYDINEVDNIAIAIFQEDKTIDWMDSNVFVESTWELLLFYFDAERKLLYVNSSVKGVEESVVERVAEVSSRFEMEEPFKCYAGLGYVVLFTLGLYKNTDSPIKYAMYAGDDVYDGISDMEKKGSSKANTYGYGYEDSVEITLGASRNGKIWSRLVGNVQEWKDWCDALGTKLIDPAVDVGKIFKGFLQPRRFNIKEFPSLQLPVSVDWPTELYLAMESNQYFVIDGLIFNMEDITLFINAEDAGFRVHLITEAKSFYLDIIYTEEAFEWKPNNFSSILYGRRGRSTREEDFIVFLKDDTFRIRLLDGTFVENNYHFKPFESGELFRLNVDLLTTLDWTGTNISVESMGLGEDKILDSVQYRAYQYMLDKGIYDIIVNDDSSGEVADIICFGIDEENEQLIMELIHCKFMLSSEAPGSRARDFYELACQAQKSIKNCINVDRLYDHLRSRESRSSKKGQSRFLKGDLRQLEIMIRSHSLRRPKYKVTMVQPALIKDKVNNNVLELLGSTYTLLQETLNARFEVICS